MRKKECKKTNEAASLKNIFSVVENMWISKLKIGSYIETALYELFLLQVTNYELNLETLSN